MSKIIEKLARSQRITEWLDPHDPRLVAATGQPAPNPGGKVRTSWDVAERDWPQLEAHLRRLLVPKAIGSRVVSSMVADEYTDRFTLDFANRHDLEACMPLNEHTAIFKRKGRQAWAAIALCGNTFGLAIFAQELEGGATQAKTQPVPEKILTVVTAH